MDEYNTECIMVIFHGAHKSGKMLTVQKAKRLIVFPVYSREMLLSGLQITQKSAFYLIDGHLCTLVKVLSHLSWEDDTFPPQ